VRKSHTRKYLPKADFLALITSLFHSLRAGRRYSSDSHSLAMVGFWFSIFVLRSVAYVNLLLYRGRFSQQRRYRGRHCWRSGWCRHYCRCGLVLLARSKS
jgi:hypothetical protein